MKDTIETQELAIIGMSYSGKIIYNLVDNEGDFKNTGLSILRMLKKDKNLYLSKMYQAQSYLSIKYFFDDEIIYNNKESIPHNTNQSSYDNIVSYISKDSVINNLYVYDTDNDLLIINTPETNGFIALDYKDIDSVKEFTDEYFLNLI